MNNENINELFIGAFVFAYALNKPDGVGKIVKDEIAFVGEGGLFNVIENVFD